MTRGIHSDVITELAKDSFNMAHLVSIDFATTLYLTDFAYDIVYASNTYNSSSHLLSMADVNETADAQIGTFTINLSGVDQAFISILLSDSNIDREVIISRAILNSSGAIIGTPIPLYNGRIDGFAIKEDNTTSQINLSTASHWSDFEKESGRRTNYNSQQIFFPGDKGFEFASSAVKDIKWGRV